MNYSHPKFAFNYINHLIERTKEQSKVIIAVGTLDSVNNENPCSFIT